jgi:hypothetical protein
LAEDLIGVRTPDPERVRLTRSIYAPSSLDAVAEAVAVATQVEKRIYVERTGDEYRWSLTHPGGPYPILRITARFLRVDYHAIVVGSRKVADGVCVIAGDPASDLAPDAWAVLYFDGPTEPSDVKRRILLALGLHNS